MYLEQINGPEDVKKLTMQEHSLLMLVLQRRLLLHWHRD